MGDLKKKEDKTVFERNEGITGVFIGYQAVYLSVILFFYVFDPEISATAEKIIVCIFSGLSIVLSVLFLRYSVKEVQGKWNGTSIVLLMTAIVTLSKYIGIVI